ncbi:hypothetical protein RIF29_19342 [Crotalaria pallida]|uniref:Uncharacterized protein n=1 Tax=Crotalaria pallida TaxID=3830 RepID=A0AAN9I5E9_CROPI
MFEPHIPIRDIKHQLRWVAFRERITMLWKVPTNPQIDGPYNLLLMDSLGDEIQASVYTPLVPFFSRYMHDGGTYDCFLVGDYINEFRSHVSLFCSPLTAVLIRLGKAQECRGRIVFYIVLHVSKLLVNPNIPDVVNFRRRMLYSGFCCSPPMLSYAGTRRSVENKLMGDFPPITLELLKSVSKPGFYTVSCTIVGVSCYLKKWYYYECNCKAILSDDCSTLLCTTCGAVVSNPVQRIGETSDVSQSSNLMTCVPRSSGMLLNRVSKSKVVVGDAFPETVGDVPKNK